MTLQSVNPATGETLARYEHHTRVDVEARLTAARRAFAVWRETSFDERRQCLRRLAWRLRRDRERYSRLITLEMGKPIAEAEAEIEKCAWNCDFYADHGETFLAERPVKSSARYSAVRYEPLGVVLAVMPWNFPFWQVIRFLAPALMAGNGALLKHASNVPQCALALEEMVAGVDLPPGLFAALLIPPADLEAVIGDPRIAAVTLTGSSDAGSSVAATAGRHLKKQVLELGGSDPFVVLADADIELAASTAVRARNQNNGQSCIAAKRFIVEEAVAVEFTRRVAEQVAALKVGDPLLRETQIGPLARLDLVDTVTRQVRESIGHGAREVAKAPAPAGSGYYFSPVVLDHVTPAMPVFAEETFGPVAAVLSVKDLESAVTVANQTEYGLAASVWTTDVDRGRHFAQRVHAGSVFINGMVASDPRLPFGGVKRSGYGRELGAFGIREFANIKTLWVGPAIEATGPPPIE